MKNQLIALILICLWAVCCLSAQADDNTVEVEKSEQAFTIYARGTGCGYTLESAKSAAFSSIMPKLINKTLDIPVSIQNIQGLNGVETGEGMDKLAAETLIQGYWELKDGVYKYTVEIILKNTDNTEDAEKP